MSLVGETRGTREPKWYAVYLRSKFEKRTCNQLQKRQVECFLPLVEELRIWSDRKKMVRVPLFPGYLFVRIDLSNRLTVLEADGVVKFVGIRDHPSPVPEEPIKWVQIVVGYPETVRREEFFSAGELVEVTAGPFRGIRGFVMRSRKTTRVVISVESIAQAISVEVAPEFLKALAVARDAS